MDSKWWKVNKISILTSQAVLNPSNHILNTYPYNPEKSSSRPSSTKHHFATNGDRFRKLNIVKMQTTDHGVPKSN